jgi:GR25 family glycosyltransferase involved in LPS biosynthesis/tetratricopeptide (TPR) repeat protein
MIVKNESHIIVKTLENILSKLQIDYWVISDTGSTDNTPQLIEEFFQSHNIPGELKHDTWKDFGHNRSIALEHAYKKTDYLFIFDADDKIVGKMDTSSLTEDMYSIQFGNDFKYSRVLLINNHKRWKFIGVVHEYLKCSEDATKGLLSGDYYVDSQRLGNRSKDDNKYKKDAIVLLKAYEHEQDKSLKERYAFYLAQSYKDSNQHLEAIEWYKKVLTLDNWAQEKYYACIMLGTLYHVIHDFENMMFYDMQSFDYDPERIEGIVHLCRICYEKKMHTMVNLLYEAYKHVSLTSIDISTKLFITSSSYQDELSYYNSISCYYIKNITSGYESCKRNLLNKYNESRCQTTLDNLIFYQEVLNKDTDTYALFTCITRMMNETLKENHILLWNLLFKKNIYLLTQPVSFQMKNKEHPKVLLSFTTCKRLELFCKTVNSILNCWEDIHLVDYWLCVDDHSSTSDRENMQELYPWMHYIMKDNEKGHQSSMNLIYDQLVLLKPTYWIHMEDDFLFFDKMNYVTQGIRGLTTYPMKQILFNRSYAESIDHYRICSHKKLCEDFSVHEYLPNKKCEVSNCYYWPHYSFRPSIIDVSTILSLGNYDTPDTFFERTYANRWAERGYTSGFFNKITNIHIGRNTKDRTNPSIPNAYSLNHMEQFIKPVNKPEVTIIKIKIVNLKYREDRKQHTIRQLETQGYTPADYEFVEATDAYSMEPTMEMYQLFKKNDFGNRKGVIGCALSHYYLWKRLLNQEDEYYLIMEDDCTFVPQFREQLNTEIVVGDVLFLGYSMFSHKRDKVKSTYDSAANIESFTLDKSLYIGGLFAYIIHKSGAQKLCSYIEKEGIQHGIDYLILKMNNINAREVRPQLVFTEWCEPGKTIDSNIQTNSETFCFEQFTDDGYVFIRGKDQIGEDICRYTKSWTELKKECNQSPTCIGFNTLGFMKHTLRSLTSSRYFAQHDGIFIKKNVYDAWIKQRIRVKLMCNWCNSKTLVEEWSNLFMYPYGWNTIEFTWEDTNIDYFIIVNSPQGNDYFIPEKTIVFTMEPWVYDPTKPWGVKTWGKWASPDETKFLKVLGRKQNEYNNVFWQLEQNYQALKDIVYSKQDTLSCICSNKYFDEGHIHRIDFLRFLEEKGDIPMDIYGNEPSFKNYRKQLLQYRDKSQGIIPYKYYFMVENNYEENFVTEKLWEPILCESLCFYFGCPNVKDILDERAFVLLDMYDFEKSYLLIQQAMREDWWSQRIEFIKKEKHRLLEEMAFCPRVEKIILEHQQYSIKN